MPSHEGAGISLGRKHREKVKATSQLEPDRGFGRKKAPRMAGLRLNDLCDQFVVLLPAAQLPVFAGAGVVLDLSAAAGVVAADDFPFSSFLH